MSRPIITEENILDHKNYEVIFALIEWAANTQKNIEYKHLRYALVKNYGLSSNKEISGKKKNQFEVFFSLKQKESVHVRFWENGKGKTYKYDSFLDQFRNAGYIDNRNKIPTNAALNHYLSKLESLHIIKKKKDKKIPYYKPTVKGIIVMHDKLIHEYLNDFIRNSLPKLYNVSHWTDPKVYPALQFINTTLLETFYYIYSKKIDTATLPEEYLKDYEKHKKNYQKNVELGHS